MKFIERMLQAQVFDSFSGSFVSALLGSRRVGKSSLVSIFAKEHSEWHWVILNMDSLEQRRELEQKGLQYVIETQALCAIGAGKKLWIAIDEAQKCPALFEMIKIIYDRYKGQDVIKFILTGSGYLELHQLTAESLAGRIELFYINEFCLRECYAYNQQSNLLRTPILNLLDKNINPVSMEKNISDLLPYSKVLQTLLEEQLIWGALPETFELPSPMGRLQYLANYIQTYLEKDIRSINAISDLPLYRNLLDIVAEQTGSIRQDKSITESLGCSRDTLKKYRGYLQTTLIYQEIYPYISSTLKRIIKSPKGYLLNNGLISYLTGLHDFDTLQKTGLIGHRFENWFLKELKVWLSQQPHRSEIYYWRTATEMEVDFVVTKPPFVFPFEVTYSRHIINKKCNNLQRFMEDNSKISAGFYIYTGDFDFDPKRNIYFIPAWCIG